MPEISANLSIMNWITIVIAIIGWSVAFWKIKAVHKLEKESVIFENRLRIYNEYFQKLDEINEHLRIDFEEFAGSTINKLLAKILRDEGNYENTIFELQEALNDIQIKATKTMSESEQELQKLRFIASADTLGILDNYRKLAKKQLDQLTNIYGSVDIQNFQNFDRIENEKLKEIGEELREAKNELEIQMRKDLVIK